MNGIEKITARIETDTKAEVGRILREAEEKAAALRRRLEEEQVPENDVTVRLRGAIVNLNTVRKSAEKAQEAYDAAKSALAQAEEKLSASPFAGQTAEEARRTAAGPLPKARRSPLPLLLTALACLCVSLGGGLRGVFLFQKPRRRPGRRRRAAGAGGDIFFHVYPTRALVCAVWGFNVLPYRLPV